MSQATSIPSPTRLSLWRSVRFGLISAVIVALASLFLTNQYTSTSTLLPPPQPRGNGLAMGLSMLGMGAEGGLQALGDQNGFREINILESRWLAVRLLQARYHFGYKRWYFSSAKDVDSTLYDFLEPKDMDQAVKTLEEWVDASRDLKSGLITLKIHAPSPELAQQMSQNALKGLDEFLQQETREAGSQRAKFYQDRLADVQRKALESEQNLARFAAKNINYSSSFNPDVRLEGIRLEADLQGMRQLVSSMTVALQQAMVDESNTMPVVTVLDHPEQPNRKSGPFRSLIVLAALLAFTAGAWLRRHWRWLASRIDGLEQFSDPGTADGTRG